MKLPLQRVHVSDQQHVQLISVMSALFIGPRIRSTSSRFFFDTVDLAVSESAFHCTERNTLTPPPDLADLGGVSRGGMR